VIDAVLLSADQECDELIALARPRIGPVVTVATQTGAAKEEVNDNRTSSGRSARRARKVMAEIAAGARLT
jgi:hypothetical protein